MTASMPPDGLSLLWCASDDVERSERYKAGGYHPVCLGDILATSAAADARRYRVLHKLGHGSFSTVWLASDLHDPDAAPGYVAVKICVADANAAHQLAAFKAAAGQHVVELLDSFLLRGPNGTHLALVHPVLGSLEDLPHLAVAQPLCRQLAEGVAFLHARGVVHGDLHLGNVGVSLPTLQTHSMRALVNYEGQPDVTVMLSLGHAERPEGLPPYLVQPLALAEFLSLRDPEFMDSAWNVKIMDLGNGQFKVDASGTERLRLAQLCSRANRLALLALPRQYARPRSCSLESLAPLTPRPRAQAISGPWPARCGAFQLAIPFRLLLTAFRCTNSSLALIPFIMRVKTTRI